MQVGGYKYSEVALVGRIEQVSARHQMQDEVLAKAFCAMAIITKPGTKNKVKEMFSAPILISVRPPPSARVKTAKKRSVVTMGARSV